MPSPSDNLRELLADLQLCTSEQLANCERSVRQLTRFLPEFDQCWLDVLVARRLLTPWQADCLATDQPTVLRQGPYRLREPLGEQTWLAETPDRRKFLVMRRIVGRDDADSREIATRAESLVEQLSTVRAEISPVVCLPREFIFHASEPGGWLVSPFVPGWRLDELIIRGGRMPWPVVAEIGSALLHALASLSRNALVHGDISLRNVRLQANGSVRLVDPFTSRLREPSVGFRSDLRLRDVEAWAPELVGSGQLPDALSDLYSVGCVLWRALTSRPPFLSADPVNFLVQAGQLDVEDVRQWVPDCPDWMAQLIRSHTRRRPELRPQTAAAAQEAWQTRAPQGHRTARRMLRRLPDRRLVMPGADHSRSARRRLLAAGVSCILVAGVTTGYSLGLIPLPLRVNVPPSVQPELPQPSMASVSSSPVDAVPALPQPDADGVVLLTAGQRYRAALLRSPGGLRIHTAEAGLAVVELSENETWEISADQVQISNVRLRRPAHGDASSPLPQLRVISRALDMRQCWIGAFDEPGGTGVEWQQGQQGSTMIQLTDVVFHGGRYAIHTRQPPVRLALTNVLFDAPGAAWRCDTGPADEVHVKLHRVTQRGGHSFLDLLAADERSGYSVDVSCGDSVLAPSTALVRIAADHAGWQSDRVRVSFRLPTRSGPTVVPPDVNPVVVLDHALRHLVALPDSQIFSESLLQATPVFAGPRSDSLSPDGAQLEDFDGPKLGDTMPGVDVSRLPRTEAENADVLNTP